MVSHSIPLIQKKCIQFWKMIKLYTTPILLISIIIEWNVLNVLEIDLGGVHLFDAAGQIPHH